MIRRRFLSALAGLALIAACGGSGDSPAGPQQGDLFFRVDAQSCTGSGVLEFFFDGTNIGSQRLGAGETSRAFRVAAGQHTVGAREATAGGFNWPNQTVNIPVNGSYTHILLCG